MKHNVDLLFTYVCAFEVPEEREYLTRLADMVIEKFGLVANDKEEKEYRFGV